jgi:hypothetical protein
MGHFVVFHKRLVFMHWIRMKMLIENLHLYGNQETLMHHLHKKGKKVYEKTNL